MLTLNLASEHVTGGFSGYGTYGRMPDDLTDSSNVVTNASFLSVGRPIGRERLMCNGKGAPRSLVKNELTATFSMTVVSFNLAISFVRRSFSAVAGYPRSSQQRSSDRGWKGTKTYTRCTNASASCPRHEEFPSFGLRAMPDHLCYSLSSSKRTDRGIGMAGEGALKSSHCRVSFSGLRNLNHSWARYLPCLRQMRNNRPEPSHRQ